VTCEANITRVERPQCAVKFRKILEIQTALPLQHLDAEVPMTRSTTHLLPLLLGLALAGSSAYADTGAPVPKAKSLLARSRARFTGYLNSEEHLRTLDGTGRLQLFHNLAAQFVTSGATIGLERYASDAALLLEIKSKADKNAKPQAEVASAYGAKLLVERELTGARHLPYSQTHIRLRVQPAHGEARDAVPADLPVFGIRKGQHKAFGRLLGAAMDNVANEDFK
jgi:hypothetical protein